MLTHFDSPDKTRFAVDVENCKVKQLKDGDVVTVAYEDYTRKSIPLNPTIYRIRKDLSWQQVVAENNKSRSYEEAMNRIIPPAYNFAF